ncbi:MAG: extensin family protein [Aestuariivirga sp.]
MAPLKRDFEQTRRNFCHAFKLKCRAASAKKAPAVNAVKSAEKLTLSSEKAKPIVPVPRSKPPSLTNKTKVPATENPLPREKPKTQIATVIRPQKDPGKPLRQDESPSASGDDCLAALRKSGVEFEIVPVSAGTPGCRVEVPVQLHAIAATSGKIALPDAPILSCRFARQFTLWLSGTGAALVSTHLEMKLTKISTGPGYECRSRNGETSAKLSEHAFGNAVDITTFTAADGRAIQIADAGNPASPSFQVLRSLRTTACGYFSTVLGPGSNAAHASHFHFDLGMHGKSQNYRLCQ